MMAEKFGACSLGSRARGPRCRMVATPEGLPTAVERFTVQVFATFWRGTGWIHSATPSWWGAQRSIESQGVNALK